ncbi:DJ-1/PfpI family protein [Roseinatronobacter sp. S2]|uniref:DJ-1/PfpI family protein n=1 Tax=Roseinatronobacter sp. S2 TaxID=3035471 RepID=UPI00240F24E4|nr:DJ-1/PfpI family protein [Roseinatronobacter sp. S2]WFE75785.1 DJ-1/PfpI family protein [Roseinatronobacter sp. S2]
MHIGFLVFPGIQQLDLGGPYEVFAAVPGVTVNLIWKDTAPLRSSSGFWITPTVTFDTCPTLDLICIPGGGGVNPLLTDDVVLQFVRNAARSCRLVTSVCTGSLVLGAAGLLAGKRATSHWNAVDLLDHFDAIPTAGRIVRDGAIVTAGGVTSGIDFGLEIIADLFGRDTAEIVQLGLEYDPAPPFTSGTPQSARPEILAGSRDRLSKSRAEREAIVAALADSR